MCEYNLKGLSIGMRCPECGHPISVKGSSGQSGFTEAPIGYLKNLRFGLSLMFWGFLGTTIAMISIGLGGGVPIRVVAIGTTLVWWAGVYIATEAKPGSGAVTGITRKRNTWVRWIARGTQGGWAIANVLRLWATISLPAGTTSFNAAMISAGILSVIAMGGVVVLLYVLGDLAYWMSDSDLSERMNLTAWGLGSLGVLVLAWPMISPLVQNTRGIIALPFTIIGLLFPWLLIGYLIVEILFLVCLYQMWTISRWAVRNWAEARARDRRVMDRAERESAEAQAKSDAVGTTPHTLSE